MKKKVTILLLALCLVFLAACGAPSPSDALKADLEDAKSSPDEIIEGIVSDGFGEEATQALIDKVLEFDYELGEEKIDGDTATVELTITTYPLGDVFTNVLTELFSSDMEELASMSEDELMAKMDETLMSELDAVEKSYKTDLTVTLNQEDGQWVAEESNELSNALTGGMLDFASSMMSY